MKNGNLSQQGWMRRMKAGAALTLSLAMLATPVKTQEAVTLGDYIYVPQRTVEVYGTEAVVRVAGVTLTGAGETVPVTHVSGVTLGVYVQNAKGEMTAWANPAAPMQAMRVVTGAQDTMLNLPQGQFYLRVEDVPDDYLAPEDGFYPIASGETVEITCVQPSQILVEVSDLAGGVYAGTGVLLTDAQGVSQKAVTDENGVAAFTGLAQGTYTISEEALPEGALPLNQETTTVELGQAQLARVAFAHPQKGRMRVMLTAYGVDETGAPFTQAMENVSVHITDAAGNEAAQLKTDDLGVAEFPLDEGVYTLNIDAPKGNFTLPFTAAMAQVQNGMTTPVDIRASENGGRIVLTFTGAGEDYTKAKVSLYDAQGKKRGTYRADENGRVVTDLLEAGAYTVTVDALPGDTRADDTLSTPEGEIALETGALSVVNGESTQATLVLRAVREQTFTVLGVKPLAGSASEETALGGAKVELYDEDGKKVESCTLDENASATLSLLSGDYTVRVKDAEGFEGMSGTLSVGAGAQTVRVATSMGRVEISFVNEESARLAGAQVRVTDEKKNSVDLTADENGRVLSPLMTPGSVTIETIAAPEGYVIAQPVTAQVESGKTAQAQVQFVRRGSVTLTVSGKDLSDAGQAIKTALAGVTLDVQKQDENGKLTFIGTITTDENGLASAALDAGMYLISAQAQSVSGDYDAQNCAALVSITDGVHLAAELEAPSSKGGAAVAIMQDVGAQALSVVRLSLIDAQGNATALSLMQGRFVATGVDAGTYTLRCDAVCAGYSLPQDRTVEIIGGAMSEISLSLEEHATITIDRRGVTFDENMQSYVLPISGLYGVYVREGEEIVPYLQHGEPVYVTANDAQGSATLPASPEGTTYYLREEESELAPGYAADAQVYEVTVKSGDAVCLQLAATADKGFFRLQNLDLETGAALSGADFALYRVVDGAVQENAVLEFTMTGEAYRNAMALPVGTYQLVMTRAARGYALDARVADTAAQFEITPYLAQGGTVAQAVIYSAARPEAGEGSGVSAAFEENERGLSLRVSGMIDASAPVAGAHVTAHVSAPEGVTADIREVTIGRVRSESASGRYGARVMYALYDGGWQMADLRTVSGLEDAQATVDLSDAQGIVTDVAVCYFDTDTGLETLGAHMQADDIVLSLVAPGANASQIAADVSAQLYALTADETGAQGEAVFTEKTAQTSLVYTSEADVEAAYSAGVDGVIAGVVFEDQNGDGLMGAQETRRAGVTVTLLMRDAQGSDSVYDQQVSDENGAYRFGDLPMGVYTIQIDLPADAMFTVPGEGGMYIVSAIADTAFGQTNAISVEAQQTSHLAHAGIIRIARIEGRICVTEQDGTVVGMTDAEVSLRRAGSETDNAVSVTTDEKGNYVFERLAPGAYELDFVVPEGYAMVSVSERFSGADLKTGSVSAQLTLEMGQRLGGVDVTIERVGSVEGEIFVDADFDGVRGEGESALAGASVELHLVREDARAIVKATVTGEDGTYRFEDVRAGEYIVHVTLPEGYVFTRTGGDSQVSGAVGASGDTPSFTLLRGEEKQDVHIGATIPATLKVSVWQDDSYDGLRAAGERGLEGVQIALVRVENGVAGDRMTLVTDAAGEALFEAVSPGNYQVEYVMPGVWRTTKRGLDGAGSDVNASTLPAGTSDVFALLIGETDAELSIGAIASCTVSGTAFADGDDNALLDAGEAGVANVSVDLVSVPDFVVRYQTTTDENGHYAFEGIAPGRYRARFTAAQEQVFSGTDASRARGCAAYSDENVTSTDTLTLTAGDALTSIHAGVVTPGTIDGSFFIDLDDDGAKGETETGLAGVTVTLSTQTGRSTGLVAETDENGAFAFGAVRPGTYTLRVVLPEDYVFSSNLGASLVFAEHTARSSLTQAFELAGGASLTGLSFGTLTQGVIAGSVFSDANFDGLKGEREGAVRGVVVELLHGEDDPQVVTTGIGGSFRFTQLMPGDYKLRVTLPDGMVFTKEGVSLLARSDERTQESETIALAMGESVESLIIGALTPAKIGGRAWLDEDNNGRREGGDELLKGIEVTLFSYKNSEYEAVETVVTDEGGAYTFKNVLPGTYTVGAWLEDGYAFSRKVSGNSRVSCLPMTDAQSAMSETMNFVAGDVDENLDIGVVRVGTISGTVYLDADYDGEKDKNETGVENATIDVLSQDGTLVTSTISGQDGTYRLDGVRVGTYKLRFTLPDDKVFTCAGEGALIAQTDDIQASGASFAFAMGEEKKGCDVGAINTAVIAGQIFTDNDFSGTVSEGEGGVSRAAVELISNHSVVATTKSDAQGVFTFARLRPGKYSVRITLPTESLFTDAAQLSIVSGVTAHADEAAQLGTIVEGTLATQGSTGDIAVEMGGAYQLAYPAIYTSSVSGFAFEDQNISGLYDDGESALAGTQVELLMRNGEDYVSVASTRTAEDGTYRFTYLWPGQYAVRFTLPGGYLFTEQVSGADPTRNSDVYADQGRTAQTGTFTMQTGQKAEHADVGAIRPARLGDTVFVDANENGWLDFGEAQPAGIALTLYSIAEDGTRTVAAQIETDEYGFYRLDSLRPGSYVLSATLPEGYAFTQAKAGGFAEIDSDITVVNGDGTGETEVFSLMSGEVKLNCDVGLIEAR